MGCATSAEARRDMVWAGGGTPRARRSFSLPTVVDRQWLCSKSVSVLGRHSSSYRYTTLLSLSVEELMKSDRDHDHAAAEVAAHPGDVNAAAKRHVMKPCTPTLTPPNEPEVINAWELMAGLEEDEGPLTPRATRRQSLSLDAWTKELGCVAEAPQAPWMQAADMDVPVALDFDSEVLSGFREALEDTSPPPTIVSSSAEKKPVQRERNKDVNEAPVSPAATREDMPELSGIVRTRINAFQEKIERRRSGKGSGRDAKVSPSPLRRPPGGERKVVVYFTSLRGVRKTFVDCCAVRSILRGYSARVDERDVSMHAAFRAELADLLGGGPALPRVFVDGRYLGGAEDVQRLHEAGELGRVLQEAGCEAAAPPARNKLGYGVEPCAACGDVRFVPCETCYGSCKVFVQDDDDAGEFRRCPDCNENGLIRCPVCCC